MELMPIIRPTLPEFSEFEDLVRPSWDEGVVTTGRIVRAFEEEVCRQTGVAHAVAMSSCTAGLMLAGRALGLAEGAEVIVPSFTFPRMASPLRQKPSGATISHFGNSSKTPVSDPTIS